MLTIGFMQNLAPLRHVLSFLIPSLPHPPVICSGEVRHDDRHRLGQSRDLGYPIPVQQSGEHGEDGGYDEHHDTQVEQVGQHEGEGACRGGEGLREEGRRQA